MIMIWVAKVQDFVRKTSHILYWILNWHKQGQGHKFISDLMDSIYTFQSNLFFPLKWRFGANMWVQPPFPELSHRCCYPPELSYRCCYPAQFSFKGFLQDRCHIGSIRFSFLVEALYLIRCKTRANHFCDTVRCGTHSRSAIGRYAELTVLQFMTLFRTPAQTKTTYSRMDFITGFQFGSWAPPKVAGNISFLKYPIDQPAFLVSLLLGIQLLATSFWLSGKVAWWLLWVQCSLNKLQTIFSLSIYVIVFTNACYCKVAEIEAPEASLQRPYRPSLSIPDPLSTSFFRKIITFLRNKDYFRMCVLLWAFCCLVLYIARVYEIMPLLPLFSMLRL